jgi:uncharacterized protein
MNYGLPPDVVGKINDVLARYPQVERATLYGSRAKGNYKNGSDIDLTLHGGEDLTLNVVYRILNNFDDLLLPYTIDLSIFHEIGDPDIVAHIQRVGVPFYNRAEPVPSFWNDWEKNLNKHETPFMTDRNQPEFQQERDGLDELFD